jgi:hypothetical protein
MNADNQAALLHAIKECADKAAERGVEVQVHVEDFGFDGHFKATITSKPIPKEKKP